MACREIDYKNDHLGFIIKDIKWDDAFLHASFPNYEDVTTEKLNHIFNEFNIGKISQQAILQQYHEILIYNESNIYQKNILAPQVKVQYSLANLPRITYPKFTPIMEEEKVWSLNEQDLNIYFGMRLRWFGINFKEYQDFIKQVHDLCEDFDLREDDILTNPSNLGYHSVLGLRIIDYGLVNNSLL